MIADEEGARAWVADLTEDGGQAMERLEHLVALLHEENSRQNLVSTESLARVWIRHVADSAQLVRNVPRETTSWLDIGTGAGFPGLVVAILRPELPMILAEPRGRRAEWLNRAAAILDLKHVRVFPQKVERLPDYSFGVISARAVAPLDAILTLSVRFSTSQTLWRLPKGRAAQQELDTLRGWDHLFHVEQSLTDPAAGIIVGILRGRKGARA